jgi:hypothetical protein
MELYLSSLDHQAIELSRQGGRFESGGWENLLAAANERLLDRVRSIYVLDYYRTYILIKSSGSGKNSVNPSPV